MMMTKKTLIPIAAVAALGAGAYGVAQVSAASDPAQPQASLVQKIADTFHLDKSKVQAVFDQDRKDRQAHHEQNYEDRLTQAVTDGKITTAQETAILNEHNKLQAEVEAAMSNSSASKADRVAAIKKIHQEAEDWAKANNLNAKWLMPAFGFGLKQHGFGPHGHGPMMKDAPTPSASPSA